MKIINGHHRAVVAATLAATLATPDIPRRYQGTGWAYQPTGERGIIKYRAARKARNKQARRSRRINRRRAKS